MIVTANRIPVPEPIAPEQCTKKKEKENELDSIHGKRDQHCHSKRAGMQRKSTLVTNWVPIRAIEKKTKKVFKVRQIQPSQHSIYLEPPQLIFNLAQTGCKTHLQKRVDAHNYHPWDIPDPFFPLLLAAWKVTSAPTSMNMSMHLSAHQQQIWVTHPNQGDTVIQQAKHLGLLTKEVSQYREGTDAKTAKGCSSWNVSTSKRNKKWIYYSGAILAYCAMLESEAAKTKTWIIWRLKILTAARLKTQRKSESKRASNYNHAGTLKSDSFLPRQQCWRPVKLQKVSQTSTHLFNSCTMDLSLCPRITICWSFSCFATCRIREREAG